MTWLPARAAGATPFEAVIGLRPELREDLAAFAATFDRLRPLDPALLALCRTRVAQLLGCEEQAAAHGLAPERRAALDDWRARADFTQGERACLAFTEKFVLDPHGIGDQEAAAVSTYLGAPAMVAFVEALALMDGFTRFRLLLGIGDATGRPA